MITAENTYTKEYIMAHRSYFRGLTAFKNLKQALIIKIIAETVFLIWILTSFPQKTIFALISYIAAFHVATRIIADFIDIWKIFFSKKKLIPDDLSRRFIFSDDSFGMISQKENYYAERYRRYPSLHSAVEWGDWFFVYYTPGEVCIIKNTDLTEGTPDELRQLLKDKLGSRFSQKGTAK